MTIKFYIYTLRQWTGYIVVHEDEFLEVHFLECYEIFTWMGMAFIKMCTQYTVLWQGILVDFHLLEKFDTDDWFNCVWSFRTKLNFSILPSTYVYKSVEHVRDCTKKIGVTFRLWKVMLTFLYFLFVFIYFLFFLLILFFFT